MNKKMIKRIALCLATLPCLGLFSCTGGDNPSGVTSGETTPVTDTPTVAVTDTPTEEATEPTPTVKDELGLSVSMSDLSEAMQPLFAGTTTQNETVMFLDYGESKTLLYPIESVISVTSYDGSKTYEAGKDYVVEDGKLTLPAGSAIPCITSEKFYNATNTQLHTIRDGVEVPTHSGEGQIMTNWQVNVHYTHAEGWNGFAQPCELEGLRGFVSKLIAGEDVTILFYGDSITAGATSSWLWNYAPHKAPYTHLLVQALADLFDYTVHYVPVNLTSFNGMGPAVVPTEDYVAGNRGTITYVNTAVGGWTSDNALTYFDEYVGQWIQEYGCDLMVMSFGMNDPVVNISPRMVSSNLEKVAERVWALTPDTNIIMMSTMMPNPNATKQWFNLQDKQEKWIGEIVEEAREAGKACVLTSMTSMSQSVLERKDFHDYSANNINHPNDFFSRVYAQTLLQTIIGYENMN